MLAEDQQQSNQIKVSQVIKTINEFLINKFFSNFIYVLSVAIKYFEIANK